MSGPRRGGMIGTGVHQSNGTKTGAFFTGGAGIGDFAFFENTTATTMIARQIAQNRLAAVSSQDHDGEGLLIVQPPRPHRRSA